MFISVLYLILHYIATKCLYFCTMQVWYVPYSNRISPWLTEFGPLPWQAKQTVSDLCKLQPAKLAGQILLVYGTKFRQFLVTHGAVE